MISPVDLIARPPLSKISYKRVRLLVLRHRRVLGVLGPERAGVDHDGKVAEGVELGDPLAVEVVAAVDEAALQPREVHLGQEREVLHP